MQPERSRDNLRMYRNLGVVRVSPDETPISSTTAPGMTDFTVREKIRVSSTH
jgi:hypothetical protein